MSEHIVATVRPVRAEIKAALRYFNMDFHHRTASLFVIYVSSFASEFANSSIVIKIGLDSQGNDGKISVAFFDMNPGAVRKSGVKTRYFENAFEAIEYAREIYLEKTDPRLREIIGR